jgi:hypothetical protein
MLPSPQLGKLANFPSGSRVSQITISSSPLWWPPSWQFRVVSETSRQTSSYAFCVLTPIPCDSPCWIPGCAPEQSLWKFVYKWGVGWPREEEITLEFGHQRLRNNELENWRVWSTLAWRWLGVRMFHFRVSKAPCALKLWKSEIDLFQVVTPWD